MIINQNNFEYSAKYAKLFQDAYTLLEEEGKLQDAHKTQGTFTSLEEYFMYIGDLAKIHSDWVQGALEDIATNWNEKFAKYSRFLMIPLDEERFKINANSRTISIPASFAQNGVSLVGDQRAETLIFEVDRYFDFIDLLRTNIYVQWTNPAGEEGATLVHLVDYDDKKIRFGWVLSDKVTVQGGNNLTFSIRFFMRNASKEITYSLNTLPISVKVKPALRLTIEDTYTDEAPFLFVEAIVNGANSNSTDFPQQAIIFENLPEDLVYLSGDSYVFELGAYPKDTGVLSYSWIFKAYDDPDTVINLTTDEAKGIAIAVEMEKTTDTEVVTSKRYYVVDEEDPTGFKLFDGTTFDAATEYYCPIAKCAINPSSTNLKVAGEYSVNIINSMGGNTTVKKSNICVIPHPKTITYTKDLVDNSRDNILTEGKCTLSVATTPDNLNATQTYEWYKIEDADDEVGSLIPDVSAVSYEATVPGWYYVKTKNTLNRVTIEEDSKKAKVTNEAIAPEVAGATGSLVNINFNDLSGASEYNIVINASVPNPESLDDDLISEGLTYEWLHQKKEAEEEYEPVVIDQYGVVAIDNHILTVKYNGDVELFKCRVTNTLNKDTESIFSDTYAVVKY